MDKVMKALPDWTYPSKSLYVVHERSTPSAAKTISLLQIPNSINLTSSALSLVPPVCTTLRKSHLADAMMERIVAVRAKAIMIILYIRPDMFTFIYCAYQIIKKV